MSENSASTDVSSHATLGRVNPILRVDSVDRSVRYYLEQLGFSLQWRDGMVAGVTRGQTSFILCQGDQGHPGTWVWIPTSDVDALYAEMKERGAKLRHAPANYPWGSRECQVTDPDGHVLRFGADLKPGEPFGDWIDGEGRTWTPEPDGGWRSSPESGER